MITTTAAGRTWHYSHALGRETGEHNGNVGGFMFPQDVVWTPGDVLFVLSRGFGHGIDGYEGDMGKRIGKTTIDEVHLGDFARDGFTWPVSMDVSSDGVVFVSDEFENKIVRLPADRLTNYPEKDPDGGRIEWGEAGSADGQFDGPAGVALEADGTLLVVDRGNGRVQRYTREGTFLGGWGREGSGQGEFGQPWGVAVDAKGDVYVADWGNDRVQKFSSDGTYLMSFGGDPDSGAELDHPANVAVDSDGDVYVTDWGNRRVQIYEPDGEIITALHGDANELSKAGHHILNRDPESRLAFDAVEHAMSHTVRFERPVGIDISPDDRVLITDICGRVLVYDKDRAYEPPTA